MMTYKDAPLKKFDSKPTNKSPWTFYIENFDENGNEKKKILH